MPAGRLAERLETTKKANDIQRRTLDAAADRARLGVISIGGCAKGGSEPGGWACPPVVEHDTGLQARAAEELELLPVGSAWRYSGGLYSDAAAGQKL